jgi:hypothetical protein
MMSNFGGPNSNFEKDFNKRFKGLSSQLRIIEKRLQASLAYAYTNPQKSKKYWNEVSKEIDAEYRAMNDTFEKWSANEIPLRYRKSMAEISAKVSSVKSISNNPQKGLREMLGSTVAKSTQEGLYLDAMASWRTALNQGRLNLHRLTRATRQLLLREEVINKLLADGMASGNIMQAVKALSGEFVKTIFDAVSAGRFVQAGRYRYTPEYYALLVARTKFHEAHSLASLDQAKNYGTDLVIVSSHNTTTAICIPFEGKIYSISGEDKRFPPLFDTPPFHPNCLHLIYPQFESALEASGQLEGFSKFSKGETDAPPAPAGFKPLSEREG